MTVTVITESGNVRVRAEPSLSSKVIGKCLRNCTYNLADNLTKDFDGLTWIHVIGEGGVIGWSVMNFFQINPDKVTNEILIKFTADEIKDIIKYCEGLLK